MDNQLFHLKHFDTLNLLYLIEDKYIKYCGENFGLSNIFCKFN